MTGVVKYGWVGRLTLVLDAVLCLLRTPAESATANIGAARDNSIFHDPSNNSGGGLAGLFSGTNGNSSTRRALIAFDIAGNVPAGSTITDVKLTLYLGLEPKPDTFNIGLHKLTRDWGEGNAIVPGKLGIDMTGMGATPNTGDATWNENSFTGSSSSLWTSAGGDFVAAASAIASVGGPVDTPFTWGSTPQIVSDVQSWLDVPDTNYGWILKNTDEIHDRTLKAFYSREATQNSSGVANSLNPAWRPNLLVTYTNSESTSGDYNGNSEVDAADYVDWRKTLGQPAFPAGSGADGDQSETIGDGDYVYWRARFGSPVGGFASAATVPEPATVTLIALVGPLVFLLKRR